MAVTSSVPLRTSVSPASMGGSVGASVGGSVGRSVAGSVGAAVSGCVACRLSTPRGAVLSI